MERRLPLGDCALHLHCFKLGSRPHLQLRNVLCASSALHWLPPPHSIPFLRLFPLPTIVDFVATFDTDGVAPCVRSLLPTPDSICRCHALRHDTPFKCPSRQRVNPSPFRTANTSPIPTSRVAPCACPCSRLLLYPTTVPPPHHNSIDHHNAATNRSSTIKPKLKLRPLRAPRRPVLALVSICRHQQ
jgi:hypothetical protein